MKTEEILNLDCRKKENMETIQKVLKKIKPFAKYEENEKVPLEDIERLIRVLCRKYEVITQWVMMSYFEVENTIYSIGVKTTTDHKWLGTVYGVSIYEVFAKLVIKMYSEIKSGNIQEKVLAKYEKERERIAKRVEKGDNE